MAVAMAAWRGYNLIWLEHGAARPVESRIACPE